MNMPEIWSKIASHVKSVPMTAVGAVIAAIFYRNKIEITEFENIKAKSFENVIKELLDKGVMTYTELYKARNFLEIAKKADEYYSQKPENEKQIYDFDWFIRFYESVGCISDQFLQDLWAKVLAGELYLPGQYSYRVLDVIKNLSKTEAELFIKASNIMSSNCVIHIEEYMQKNEISYENILYLSDCGLINPFGDITCNVLLQEKDEDVMDFGKAVLFARKKDDQKIKISIPVFPLTESGKALYGLVVDKKPDKIIENSLQIKNIYPSISFYLRNVYERLEDGTPVFSERDSIIDL